MLCVIMARNIVILLLFIFHIFGCNNPDKQNVIKNADKIKVLAKKIIEPMRDSMMIPPILLSPSPFDNLPIDSISENGNYINYRITKDSLCSDNIYIEWGNKSFLRTHICSGVRQLRSYFTPRYVGETKEYLIFEYGCATDCQAVHFLPLNKTEKVNDLTRIIKYDKLTFTVVRENEIYEDEFKNEKEFLEAYNVKTRKIKRIKFKNNAISSNRRFVVDSCHISKDWIFISADLYDRDNDKEIKEVIRIRNDIK